MNGEICDWVNEQVNEWESKWVSYFLMLGGLAFVMFWGICGYLGSTFIEVLFRVKLNVNTARAMTQITTKILHINWRVDMSFFWLLSLHFCLSILFAVFLYKNKFLFATKTHVNYLQWLYTFIQYMYTKISMYIAKYTINDLLNENYRIYINLQKKHTVNHNDFTKISMYIAKYTINDLLKENYRIYINLQKKHTVNHNDFTKRYTNK